MVGLRLDRRLAGVSESLARFGLKRRDPTPAGSAVDAGASAREPRLMAYTLESDARARRRTRLLITAVVSLFCLFQGLVFAFFAPYLIPMFLIVPAVLLAFIVWALPDARNPPTRTMETLFVAFFIVMLMWPNYLAISLPGLPWITLIRLTGLPMVFLFAVSFSQSASVREQMKAELGVTPWIWNTMLVMMAIIVLTLPMSQFVAQSIQSVILTFTNWFAIYLISVYFFREKGRVLLWVLLLCGMMALLGVMAIFEAHYKHILWAYSIPSFLKVQDPTIIGLLKGSTRRYTTVYRSQTTFESPLGFGEFIAIVFPYALYFIISQYYSIKVRIGATLLSLFFLDVAFLSGSRSAVLGALVATMLTLGVWGLMRWRDRKESLLGPAIVLSYPVAGALVLAATFVVGRIRHRIWGGAETQSSTQARVDQWHQGIPHLYSNPIGHGMNNAGIILNYRLPDGQLVIDSYFLKILLDWGVMGFLVFFGMVAAAVVYAGRIVYDNGDREPEMGLLIPAAISLLTWVLIKFVNAEESNHPIIFMTMGMVTALAYRHAKNRCVIA